jgi:hypothetical protein
MVKEENNMSEDNDITLNPSEFATPTEHRMEWEEAINTVDEVLEFYYDYNNDYDRNDIGTIQRAWQRIQQG